jgi:alpha-galactosidase
MTLGKDGKVETFHPTKPCAFPQHNQREMVASCRSVLVALASATVVVTALDNGFDSPPMGWSALYGAPFNSVNETMLVRAAEGLKASGLAAKGYEYITIDDWWAMRDPKTGELMAVPDKFPSGMKAIGKKIHAQGCKFGVYSAASERTCANFSASLFNEKRDAHTMAIEWEIDFLKYDSCRYSGGVASRARYEAMGRALNATGRKIFYSVEGWRPDQGDWGPELANMWRTGSDIWPFWDTCIMHNLYQTNVAAPYNRHTMAARGQLADHAGGGYNDGDMLQPPGDTLMTVRQPGLSSVEAASQFKLWSIMKTPLILGAMRKRTFLFGGAISVLNAIICQDRLGTHT